MMVSKEKANMMDHTIDWDPVNAYEVLDHVIVGDGTTAYFSFADAGILHKERD
jgi:hypothetical protein